MLHWNDVLEFGRNGNPAPDRKVVKTEAEWRAQLTGEEYRVTLVLRHVNGLSCEEIAETLGVSLGTVTSRLSRAHKILREKLAKLMEPDK